MTQMAIFLCQMSRSTALEKSQRLNTALELLSNGYTANRAAEMLAGQFGISLRQAYRYLLEAQQRVLPLPILEPTIPMTIKIPKGVALRLRNYAHANNLTIGELISRAVLTYLASEGYHG